MADQVIRKRMIDGEEYDVIYRHSVPLKDLNTIPGGMGVLLSDESAHL